MMFIFYNEVRKEVMNMYNYYNPYQPQMVQPYNPMPSKPNFDFNGKWVNSIEEVNQINNDNLPIISMDRNQNRFYMRLGNELKAYEYKEVEIVTQDKEIDSLKSQIKALNSTIEQLSNKLATTIPQNTNTAQNGFKKAVKEHE